ncbi:MAG: hypothetical protein WAY93_06395 [Atopobiaceae bacterium]|jgi:hypothetical protein|nr:hypothetical protein [Atopobiaceae bacterium]
MRYSVESGEGDLRVVLDASSTDGHGLACFLSGGTRPHVGGVALASPGAKLDGRGLSRCDLWTSTVPGHKDVEAAAAVARRLCLATGEVVSVAAGIHVDDATPADLAELSGNCLDAADRLGSAYAAGDGR